MTIIMMIAVDFVPHFWTYPLCFVRFVRQLFAHPIRFLLQELAVSVENRSHFFWLLEMIEIWTERPKYQLGLS